MGPGVSALIGFVSVPITTWLVSPEDFGKASMFAIMHMLASLILFMGLDQAFVREFHSTVDKRKLLFNAVMPPLLFSVIFSGILLAFYKQVSTALYGSISFYAVLATSVPIPFLVIERFNQLIARMEEKGKLYSAMHILRRVIDLVLLAGIVYFHRNFLGVISARGAAICISALLSLLIMKSRWKPGPFLDAIFLRKLFRYGLPLVPAAILGWVLNAMDKVALRLWTDFGEMGIYSAGFRVVSALLIFQAAFSTFWAPTAYRWYETGEKLEKFERVSSCLSFFLCIIGGAVILFRRVIIMVLAPVYAPAAAVVPFLIFYPILYTLSETTRLGINFTRRTELGIWVSLVAAGTNLLGNWMLVPEYGALGASIATAVSYMAFFWMRTLISGAVWKKIPLRPHIVNLSLLSSISIIAVFQDRGTFTDIVAYAGMLMLIGLMLLMNAPLLAYAKKVLSPPR